MNLANKITLSRVCLIPVMVALLYGPGLWAKIGGVFVFTIAALSDLVDGKIARKRGEVTDLGAVMDPVADKVLVLSAFAVLVERGVVPAYLMILVLAREIAISGVRIVAASKGVVIAASSAGKTKTAWQITAVAFGLLSLILAETSTSAWGGSEIYPWLRWHIPYATAAVAALLSFTSGVSYFKAAWPVLDPGTRK